MRVTRTALPCLLLSVACGRAALAQTPTFLRVDTPVHLSLQGTMTVADFDRDGIPDLVLETRSLQEVLGLHFLRGLGDGTFAPPVQVFSGCCGSVGAGDFDGDRDPDLVFIGDGVGVLLGNGDGTFFDLKLTPTNVRSPRPPLVRDFNRDGRLDLAWSHQAGGISVLLGHGDGTFGTAEHFPIGGGSFANDLAAGDFNSDGVLDLAASNPGPPNFEGTNVSVLLGHGDGTFSPPADFTVGISPFPIATTDFDADGHLDIAVANYQAASVSVLLGRGDGTFAPKLDVPDGPFPVGLEAADFNGDGKPDAAIGSGATSLALLLGNGDGTLAPAMYFPAVSSAHTIAVADFNQDGKPDVVDVYLPVAGALSVFLNTTTPDTTPPLITVSADPAILWPPNGRMVAVTLAGSVTDTGSGVDASRVTFAVRDEYGVVQPSGGMVLDADGTFSVQLMLPASRAGSDHDGRTFSITVSAQDKAGNLATVETQVRVRHDRGHALIALGR